MRVSERPVADPPDPLHADPIDSSSSFELRTPDPDAKPIDTKLLDTRPLDSRIVGPESFELSDRRLDAARPVIEPDSTVADAAAFDPEAVAARMKAADDDASERPSGSAWPVNEVAGEALPLRVPRTRPPMPPPGARERSRVEPLPSPPEENEPRSEASSARPLPGREPSRVGPLPPAPPPSSVSNPAAARRPSPTSPPPNPVAARHTGPVPLDFVTDAEPRMRRPSAPPPIGSSGASSSSLVELSPPPSRELDELVRGSSQAAAPRKPSKTMPPPTPSSVVPRDEFVGLSLTESLDSLEVGLRAATPTPVPPDEPAPVPSAPPRPPTNAAGIVRNPALERQRLAAERAKELGEGRRLISASEKAQQARRELDEDGLPAIRMPPKLRNDPGAEVARVPAQRKTPVPMTERPDSEDNLDLDELVSSIPRGDGPPVAEATRSLADLVPESGEPPEYVEQDLDGDEDDLDEDLDDELDSAPIVTNRLGPPKVQRRLPTARPERPPTVSRSDLPGGGAVKFRSHHERALSRVAGDDELEPPPSTRFPAEPSDDGIPISFAGDSQPAAEPLANEPAPRVASRAASEAYEEIEQIRALSVGDEPESDIPVLDEFPGVLQVAVYDEPPGIASAKASIAVVGHRVAASASGDAGLEQIKTVLRTGNADVLLVGVPGGEDVIETALALTPRPVLIAVCTGSGIEAVRRASSVGADLAIARPVEPERLAPVMLAASRLASERRDAAARGSETLLRARLDALGDPEPGSLQPFDLFQRVLDLELKRSRRYGYPIAVALFAVEIPEEPPPGVRGILKARAGNALINAIRDIDMATEVDQERFLVLLPYTTLGGAAQVARRIIAAVTNNDPITMMGRVFPPRLTGAVAGPIKGEPVDFARLMRDATRALEQARRDGAELAVPMSRPPDDDDSDEDDE